MKKHVFVGIGAVLMTTIAWSQPTLVRDINSSPAGIFGKNPPALNDKFTVAGDLMYFPVTDQKGKELWRTDGTPDGTFRVADVNKGMADSYLMGTQLGSSFLFVNKPSQLWTTTGVESSSQLVAQIKIDDNIADALDIWTVGDKVIIPTVYGPKLHFQQYTTTAGLAFLKEIANDVNISLSLSTAVGTSRVFVLQYYDAFVYTADIWITDGTAAGTKKIATHADLIENIATHGNDIIFENSLQQVFKLSIPAGTTTQLHDFGSTTVDKLFSYSSTKSIIATGEGVWVTDETQVNTIQLLDNVVDVAQVFVANNKAYFMGYDNANSKYNLYESDGTVAGTKALSEVRDAFETPYLVDKSQIGVINGKVIVPITNPQVGMEIANVTATEKTVIRDINPGAVGSNPQMFQTFKNKLYFVADDGTNGIEVWSTDGTEGGTQLLKNAAEGTAGGVTTKDIFLFKDEIYFSASSGSIDNVWKTTGQGADAKQFFFTNSGNILGTANDSIYMITNPMMIYKSAGGDVDPILVADISTSAGGAEYPSENFSLGEKFVFNLFSFGGGTPYGRELWTLEWQTPGAALLKDIKPGLNDGIFGSTYGESKQRFYKIDETKAIFAADDGTHGVELWVTDGTTVGTTLLKDINPGAASSNPGKMNATLNGLVYFATDDGLWSTDGTSGGTMRVNSFNSIAGLAKFNNEIYVTALDGTNWALYKKSGDKVQQLASKPGEMISLGDNLYIALENALLINTTTVNLEGTPSNFYIFKDEVYFSANGQLWHSRGTLATTRWAANIEPIKFKQAGDLLFMTATSKEYGTELFKTEGQKFTQDIVFTVENKLVTDAPFQVTATSSSGLPVTIELVSGNVTLSGNTVTITQIGLVTMKATQQGDDTFEPAEVLTTFKVDPITGVGDEAVSTLVYPNPVEKELFVTIPGHLRILDSNGREVVNQVVEESIDLSGLSAGFYVAVINNVHFKIIKK